MSPRSLLLLAALVGPVATAATISVTTSADDVTTNGNCTLREAVQAANTNAAVDQCIAGDPDGDIIVFLGLPGTITLTNGEILVTDDVAIRGSFTRVTIDGNGASRLFDVNAPAGTGSVRRVEFIQLVLRNGNASAGGSSAPDAGGAVDVKSGSQVAFGSTDVLDSRCGLNGGGIHGAANTEIYVGTTAFGRALVQNNEALGAAADQGGGGIWSAGTLRIEGMVTLNNNRASGAAGSGGGVFNLGGMLTIMAGVTISNNTASRAGGGIEATAGSTTMLTGVTFSGNMAVSNPGNGGAFHITGNGTATVTGGSVAGNTAAREGAGFWNDSGLMTVTGTTFTNNVAQGSAPDDGGGAVFNNGGVAVLTDVTATGNMATGAAGSGGALFSLGGTMTVTGGLIAGNAANRAGAGIESAGAMVTLTDVIVNDNDIPSATATPGNGGGVHAGGGTLTIRGGGYTNNDATEGGGIWASGALVVEPSTTAGATAIIGNTGRGPAADNGGGGVYLEGSATGTLTGAMLMNNAATGTAGSGGAILVTSGSTATVTGGTIRGNVANRAGAGIEVAGGTLTLVGVTVRNNDIPVATAAPGNGGGLHAGGGSVTIRGGTFWENDATEGGGVWVSGMLTITPDAAGAKTVFTANTGHGPAADNGGGGLFAETGAIAVLTDVDFVGNAATGMAGSGGAVFVADGASMTITGGLVRNNQANRAGAGIEVADDGATTAATALTLTFVTVDANHIATAAPGNGGGLHVGGAGTATVRQSTFSGNTANEGAGLWMAGPSTLDIALSTVTGNTSVTEGGGIYDNGGTPSATILAASVTLVGNTAATGGGLFSQSTDSTSFRLTNSIVADNKAPTGPDLAGMVTSLGYNLVETLAGGTLVNTGATDIIGANPMLGPLADNGGPTMTHLPMAGSPVIDAGQTDEVVDQRDFLRNVGADDIGAVEFGAMTIDTPGAPAAGSTLTLAPMRPNPVRGRATLAFAVARSGAARVEVFNVLGQRVLVAFDGTATTGAEMRTVLDVSVLAPGMYVVRLQSGGAQATQRLTVAR